jgi:predicted XRE-type DNA-binding protein
VKIERGSSSVYADLGLPDAQEMLIKAKLATEINQIIRLCKLTQMEAAKILGITQPKLSGMLRGQFRGISELKMIECLNRLGRDVDIVVKPAPKTRSEGCISVVFA